LDALVAAVEAGTTEVSDTRADRQGRCAVRRAGEDVHAHLRDELAARELRLPNLPATRVALVVLEYEFIRRADEDLDEEVAGDGGEVRPPLLRLARSAARWRGRPRSTSDYGGCSGALH
jgi:hypothetical protein